MLRTLIAAGIGIVAAAFPMMASGQAPGAIITVQPSPEYGRYIADSEGRALYGYEADVQGTAGQEPVSNCHPSPETHQQSCTGVWPPFLAVEAWPADTARAGLIGTMKRPDGAVQVTYNGWPLYYYHRDFGIGQAEGHNVVSFEGRWFLLTPGGEPVSE